MIKENVEIFVDDLRKVMEDLNILTKQDLLSNNETWKTIPGYEQFLLNLSNCQIQDILEELGMLENGNCLYTAEEIFKAGIEYAINKGFKNYNTIKECIAWLEKQGERKHTNSKDDERLKKTTVTFLKDFAKQGYENAVECIDWLEKQGEQKTEIEYIYPKFRNGDVIEQIQPNGNSQPVRVLSISKKIQSYCCESDNHNVYFSIPIRCENEYKLVEQKPTEWSEHQHKLLNYAISMTDDTEVKCFLESLRNTGSNTSADWSEDDEKMRKLLIDILNVNHPNGFYMRGVIHKDAVVDWLKSLKPQKHWKPNEKQMEALEDAISCRALSWEQLESLYNDLKNL